MNLKNFEDDIFFNKLRKMMNAKLSDFSINDPSWKKKDSFDIYKTLLDVGEVEVKIEDLKIVDDGTFELFEKKVLVYIRDQIIDTKFEYKFHISNCITLSHAINNKKYDRYVASINTDGKFLVNLISNNKIVEENKIVELKICKNCLSRLNYKNYNNVSQSQRISIYNNFSIDEFFKTYQKQNIKKPKYTTETAPKNTYSNNFEQISSSLRKEKNYTCEKCKIYFNEEDRKYLHVHHKDGNKYNNNKENLIVLCIGCHAEEPDHGNLKVKDDYKNFILKYKRGFI